jgi:hypothetical protein
MRNRPLQRAMFTPKPHMRIHGIALASSSEDITRAIAGSMPLDNVDYWYIRLLKDKSHLELMIGLRSDFIDGIPLHSFRPTIPFPFPILPHHEPKLPYRQDNDLWYVNTPGPLPNLVGSLAPRTDVPLPRTLAQRLADANLEAIPEDITLAQLTDLSGNAVVRQLMIAMIRLLYSPQAGELCTLLGVDTPPASSGASTITPPEEQWQTVPQRRHPRQEVQRGRGSGNPRHRDSKSPE